MADALQAIQTITWDFPLSMDHHLVRRLRVVVSPSCDRDLGDFAKLNRTDSGTCPRMAHDHDEKGKQAAETAWKKWSWTSSSWHTHPKWNARFYPQSRCHFSNMPGPGERLMDVSAFSLLRKWRMVIVSIAWMPWMPFPSHGEPHRTSRALCALTVWSMHCRSGER